MRALDRLALYSTCTATAVIIASTALIFHQGPPRWGKLDEPHIVEQPVVQAVDLSRLTPEVRQAVEKARMDGLQHARAELESLHGEMMRKVDSRLLDWYFGYWTQQRLGLSYAYTSGKNWVASLVVDVDPEEASKTLQTEIAREFELRVMPGPILEQHLQRIAQQSVTVFVRSLQEHLQDIPQRYQVPSAQWEEYLERITFMIGGTQASRSVPLTLKALSAGVVLSGVSVTAALAPYVTAQFAQNMAMAGASRASGALVGSVGRRAATTLSRQVAARGLATGAGSWGGALTGGVALVALVAWETWDHQSTVAENRPLLRNNIDHFLQLYESGLVEPHGMIGNILHDLERQTPKGDEIGASFGMGDAKSVFFELMKGNGRFFGGSAS